MPTLAHLLLSLLTAVVVALAAWRAEALTKSGTLAATFVGFCLFGFGGGRGAITLLLFFVTSSALSRWGKTRKATFGYEKSGKRDAGQVLANGGIASFFALLTLWGSPPLHLAAVAGMLGALATANADTWATEIGSLLGGRPRRITDFKQTEPGESGAVSATGTLAAFVGALLIGLMTLTWQMEWRSVLAVTVGGFLGALADSLLGATLQVQYRDPATGRLTEQRTGGDGTQHLLARGTSYINNDAVNLLSTLLGAMLPYAIIMLL